MGVQDIKQGMYCTIRQIISGKPADTESHGEIVEQADGVLYVRFKNKDVDYKNTSLKYELDIVAANVLYHWLLCQQHPPHSMAVMYAGS
mgnify:CR=1 FL=1